MLYALKDHPDTLKDQLPDLCASFQEAVIDVLRMKAMDAGREHRVKTLILAGGVACNSRLREKMGRACEKARLRFIPAPPKYCTDNAAMIGGLAYHYFKAGCASDPNYSIHARLDTALGCLPFAPLASRLSKDGQGAAR